MKKEKVFIVISHKHYLERGTKGAPDEWKVAEAVEFVNQLRPRHLTQSSAIGDYINRKMQTGKRIGMYEYNQFETYVRAKYKKEMEQLDKAYLAQQVPDTTVAKPQLFEDEFGNYRERNVFDKVTI